MKIVWLFLVLAILPLTASSQSALKCEVAGKSGEKFKTVYESFATVDGRPMLFMAVSLQSSAFNDTKLRAIVTRIKRLYCNEKVISVQLWDRSDKRKFDDLTPPPIYAPQTRALYYLDRTAKIEKLRYYKNEKEGPPIPIE